MWENFGGVMVYIIGFFFQSISYIHTGELYENSIDIQPKGTDTKHSSQ